MQILSASDLHVPLAERANFELLREEKLRDTQPVNTLQAEFFNAALRAAWTLRRCDAAERDLGHELGIDPILAADRRFDRIERVRAQAHREYRMAIAELRRLQTDHAVRMLQQNEGLRALPVAIDSKSYIAAARAAAGIGPRQPISFAPTAAALDRLARERGWGDSAWDALRRNPQPGAPVVHEGAKSSPSQDRKPPLRVSQRK